MYTVTTHVQSWTQSGVYTIGWHDQECHTTHLVCSHGIGVEEKWWRENLHWPQTPEPVSQMQVLHAADFRRHDAQTRRVKSVFKGGCNLRFLADLSMRKWRNWPHWWCPLADFYTRLPFGISLAPEIFQRMMENILQGMKGAGCFIDDVLVSVDSVKEPDKQLQEVLHLMTKAGLKLN